MNNLKDKCSSVVTSYAAVLELEFPSELHLSRRDGGREADKMLIQKFALYINTESHSHYLVCRLHLARIEFLNNIREGSSYMSESDNLI